jgi:threonine synthase
MSTALVCAGCGAPAPAVRAEPYPFRCRRARPGDDVDHLVTRVLDPRGMAFPAGAEPSPFARYRALFHAYQVARDGGLADADYLAVVDGLDAALVAAHGRGFRVTPLGRSDPLSSALGFSGDGGLWVKNETGSVGDSHKARHLMGILIYLEVIERLGLAPPGAARPPLAIASCGNAALAAAVLAHAEGRTLRAYIPPEADTDVVESLARLGTEAVFCARAPGVAGDPCVHAFRAAVAAGALPFACDGADAGLTIDGGATLGLEMAAEGPPFDRVIVQVGGGALAAAVIQGFRDALALGRIAALPRFHAAQPRAVSPLRRAWERVTARVLARLGEDAAGLPDAARAARVQGAGAALLDEELAYAATHRSSFMWPWETEPSSVARAIQDDETYDWLAVVRGMVTTGGYPITVDESSFARANLLARRATGTRVGPSGSAGLAGLLQLSAAEPSVLREKVGVLFSGVRG